MLNENQNTIESIGGIPVLKEIKMAEKAARLREGAEDLKERVAEIFEDALSDAKRIAKKGRYAAEDLMDDAQYKIKKAPFRSISLTFAAGLGVGIFAGLLVSRMASACSSKTHD